MILIINTADVEKIFLGLVSKGKLVAKKEFKARYKQAEKLLPEINKLLQAASCKLQAISGIAIATGPGSFTALRIGISTANTLAWSLNIPIIGLRLDEFSNKLNLAKMIETKSAKAKKGKLIEPFYGKEPNIGHKLVSL
jgi:tRNA A37 threonylcarbamoyladenosine modification protein TsaB